MHICGRACPCTYLSHIVLNDSSLIQVNFISDKKLVHAFSGIPVDLSQPSLDMFIRFYRERQPADPAELTETQPDPRLLHRRQQLSRVLLCNKQPLSCGIFLDLLNAAN